MIQTTTQTGVSVTLTGIEIHGVPYVRVAFVHPKQGKMSFESTSYGPSPGGDGIIGRLNNQRACITVPRQAFDAAMAEARGIGEREIEAIRSGAKKITLRYDDGEYLSGYAVSGRAAELLESLGVAKAVTDWGYHVDGALVKALGKEFTYAQVAEYARPELEKAQAADAVKDSARAEKFSRAAATGQEVELERWSEPCCERDYECSLDIVTRYAMPDGTTRTERAHTH